MEVVLFVDWCKQTGNTRLLDEFNKELNKDIDINTLTLGSNKMLYWTCKNGHTWKVQLCNRIKYGHISECPYCLNKKAWPGYNDIKTISPAMAEMFDEERNGVSSSNVLANSTQKFYFKCPNGHSFTAVPKRFIKNMHCPECLRLEQQAIKDAKKAKAKIVKIKKEKRVESLLEGDPKLAAEFDEVKNGISVDKVPFRKDVHKMYWWVCPKGHSFKNTLDKRKVGVSCPYCSKKNTKVLSGVNDLKTEHPELMEEWDFVKNEKLGFDPSKLRSGSCKVACWKCPTCGTEWNAEIRTRSKGMMKCPKCFKRTRCGRPPKITNKS